MNKQEKVDYWLDIAEYDFKTAEAMYKSNRYLYVAFMCQQALEKMIKALYISRFDDEPPRSHNLTFLFQKTKIEIDDDRLDLFDQLTSFYIEGRYPEYKQKLSQFIDKKRAQDFLIKTKEAYKWLKSHLKY